MSNTLAIMTLFDRYFEESPNPILRWYKYLPAYVLDKLIADFAKSGTPLLVDGKLSFCFDFEPLMKSIEDELMIHVFKDEAGLLIKFGASKATIMQMTGAQEIKIINKRKVLKASSPRIGRPRIISDEEIDTINQLWKHTEKTPVIRLVMIHIHTSIPVDDIWNVVNKKPLQPCSVRSNVSECD